MFNAQSKQPLRVRGGEGR